MPRRHDDIDACSSLGFSPLKRPLLVTEARWTGFGMSGTALLSLVIAASLATGTRGGSQTMLDSRR